MSKVKDLKLRNIENIQPMATRSSSGSGNSNLGTSPSDCMSQELYYSLIKAGATVTNVWVCGLGYIESAGGNPTTFCKKCGTKYDGWGLCPKCDYDFGSGSFGSGNSGSNSKNKWCEWCIWESCYSNSGSGYGSGYNSSPSWISNPISNDESFRSYGFINTTGSYETTTSIRIPSGYARSISRIRFKFCGKGSATLNSFRIKMYLQEHYPVDQSAYGYGYGEMTMSLPDALKSNQDNYLTVSFSTTDTGGGIACWELLK